MSALQIFRQAAHKDPITASIARGLCGHGQRGLLEEGKKKKPLQEDGGAAPAAVAAPVSSGSSAIEGDTLGDYKYYGRGWMRPAKEPEDRQSLPEETVKTEEEITGFKDIDEGDKWLYANDDLVNRLADKVIEAIIANDGKDSIDLSKIEFEDTMFYAPKETEEIADTPYVGEGEDSIDLEDDDEDDEPEATEEEKAAIVSKIVEESRSFTLHQEPVMDEFAIGLDNELVKVIQEAVEKSAGEMIRAKGDAERAAKVKAKMGDHHTNASFHRVGTDDVKARVHAAAVRALREKISATKGGKYGDLGMAAKMDVDKAVKEGQGKLPSIESKLMGKYKAKAKSAQQKKMQSGKSV